MYKKTAVLSKLIPMWLFEAKKKKKEENKERDVLLKDKFQLPWICLGGRNISLSF